MVFNPFKRAGEQREVVNELKGQMRAQQLAEQQLLSNNERNLNRVLRDRREERIKQRLFSLQNQDNQRMFGRQNILTGRNIFKKQINNRDILRENNKRAINNRDLLGENNNMLVGGNKLLKQPNLFRRR